MGQHRNLEAPCTCIRQPAGLHFFSLGTYTHVYCVGTQVPMPKMSRQVVRCFRIYQPKLQKVSRKKLKLNKFYSCLRQKLFTDYWACLFCRYLVPSSYVGNSYRLYKTSITVKRLGKCFFRPDYSLLPLYFTSVCSFKLKTYLGPEIYLKR